MRLRSAIRRGLKLATPKPTVTPKRGDPIQRKPKAKKIPKKRLKFF